MYTYILIIAAAEWFLRTACASASADNGNWGAVKTDMTEDVNVNGYHSIFRHILIVIIDLVLGFKHDLRRIFRAIKPTV